MLCVRPAGVPAAAVGCGHVRALRQPDLDRQPGPASGDRV